MVERNIVEERPVHGGVEAVPYRAVRQNEPDEEPQSQDEAEAQDDLWEFWDKQIRAALTYERRWRTEARHAEELRFGPDEDPGTMEGDNKKNQISDENSLIHGNIEVLRPLLYSDSPQPLVRRRWRGDGSKVDETDLMAAECGQRLAQFLIDTTDFDVAMEGVRDDWIVPGRGAGRVYYSADVEDVEVDVEGVPVKVPVKTREEIYARHMEWSRVLFAPEHNWEQMPWLAFEIPMTRRQVERRFGKDVAAKIDFNEKGLIGADNTSGDQDHSPSGSTYQDSQTDQKPISPFDTTKIWEIWVKEDREVVWWTPACRDGVLDQRPDPYNLEHFWPMPRPLLATTKNQRLTPRPDIRFYERRAKEVDEASRKLKTILEVISVSGLFPGQMVDKVQKLLDGTNSMIPVEEWQAFMEKGGARGMVEWLPLTEMIQAISALTGLREQAKQAMFEASGISDIMRAQGDPDETATAQQLKGRYASLRLKEKQKKMAEYVRDMIRLMLELAVEHYDVDRIADITGLDLPMTEVEREMMNAENAAIMQQFQRLAQQHQMLTQAGMQVGPPPKPPKLEKVPATSWELVHDRLRTDYNRKITVMVETQSTVLADEQADKEARIEFLTAFAGFVEQAVPMLNTGVFDMKLVKELLLFGIRSFPKSRTLETMISNLPDDVSQEPQEDTQITLAKINGQIEKEIKAMDLGDRDKDREHEKSIEKMKLGGTLVGKAVDTALEGPEKPEAPEPPEPEKADG